MKHLIDRVDWESDNFEIIAKFTLEPEPAPDARREHNPDSFSSLAAVERAAGADPSHSLLSQPMSPQALAGARKSTNAETIRSPKRPKIIVPFRLPEARLEVRIAVGLQDKIGQPERTLQPGASDRGDVSKKTRGGPEGK